MIRFVSYNSVSYWDVWWIECIRMIRINMRLYKIKIDLFINILYDVCILSNNI